MAMSHALKSYKRRTLYLSLGYAAAIITAVYCFRHELVSGPLAVVVAILPAIPIIGFFAAIGRYLTEEQDEFVRMLMVRQTLCASAIALGAATIWGFLESFGLAPHIEAFYLAVVWFGGLGIGACLNRVTFGTAAAC